MVIDDENIPQYENDDFIGEPERDGRDILESHLEMKKADLDEQFFGTPEAQMDILEQKVDRIQRNFESVLGIVDKLAGIVEELTVKIEPADETSTMKGKVEVPVDGVVKEVVFSKDKFPMEINFPNEELRKRFLAANPT